MNKELLSLFSRRSEEEERLLGGEGLNRKIYTAEDEFVISGARLFGKEGEVGARSHTRYITFPEHKHSYVEMMAVLSGNIVHTVGGQSISLGEGDVIIFSKNAHHSVEKCTENDIGVNIIMEERFVSSLASELRGTFFETLFSDGGKADGEPMYLVFRTKGLHVLENLVENLLLELTSGQADTGIILKTLSLLLCHFSRRYGEAFKCGSEVAGKESRRKNEILSYIKNNYRTATLVELGERLYLSVPYLSRIVKEYFGKSFKDLLIEERLSRAFEMFRDTDMPIGEAIRSVGYENESYFHREFKSKYGMTPLTVRKIKK